jgi:phosphoribosylformimino-5-aminoimidazole carboxamide ribotide isomerase
MVAGGISSVDHLRRLAETRVESAIVGTALYTGDIDFRQAVTALA